MYSCTVHRQYYAIYLFQLVPEARSEFTEELFKAFAQKPSWM